jgi:predicted extracellular nuclease
VLLRRVSTGLAAVSLTVVGLPAVASAAPPTTPFVSEVHYDDAGTDAGEFVEVQVPAGSSSAGLSVVLYNGGNGAVYDTDPLPAVTAPAGAPAVAVVEYPVNGVQNGPDGVALVRDGAVLEFLSYEGSVAATDGPAAGTTSTDVGLREAGTEPDGQSLSRTYDAASDALVWAGPGPATRGAVNAGSGGTTPPPAATDPCAVPPGELTAVGAVQGTGAETPLAGQQVTVRGTVVADLQGEGGLDGFHLQDAGDGDAATSDGVFVSSTVPVAPGEEVAVTGTPSEVFGQTQVTSHTDVSVCADDLLPDPAAASLELPAGDDVRERLEGMLVEPADELTVSEVFALTRYGELTLSQGGVLVQPTEVARPGTPEAAAVVADNAGREVLLDDGRDTGTSLTDRPYLGPDSPVRVGDVVDLREPLVLGYGFGAWRLQPADGTADGVLAPQDTRPAAPGEVGGDVRLAAFNVLNYFLTLGGVGRGAPNEAEFEQQAAKIVAALTALDADVVTLMEIEDTDSTGYSSGNADAALADLVARLNAVAGPGLWAYVPLPAELYEVDRDVIRNGIVYRTDVVAPVGEPRGVVDEQVWDNAREPIAQTFSADGDTFTVVANHFKSKSPGEPTGDNVDSGDGQGAWNGDRVRQAGSLAAFVDRLRADTGDADVVAMGDLNAYSREDPVVALEDAGLTDLGTVFDEGGYSYVFDGLSGSLDHAMATAELTAEVTDAVHWNVNSVESSAYQYDGDPALYDDDPYRSSDHDPILVGVDLDERCQGLAPTLRGTAGDDVLDGTDGRDVVMGLDGDDVLRGGGADDVLCGGGGEDTLAGGNGADVLLGGAGADALDGGNGGDTLVGGPGEDCLEEGRGDGTGEQEGPEA